MGDSGPEHHETDGLSSLDDRLSIEEIGPDPELEEAWRSRRRRRIGYGVLGLAVVLVAAGAYAGFTMTSGSASSDATFYERCASLVGETNATGGVLVHDSVGTTVVVDGGYGPYTCNLDPSGAMSGPGMPRDKASWQADASTFAVADQQASGVNPDWTGDFVWGGGVTPKPDSKVTFHFPDGAIVPAKVRNGYWVVQYHSKRPFIPAGESPNLVRAIFVTVDGNTFDVPWGQYTCDTNRDCSVLGR